MELNLSLDNMSALQNVKRHFFALRNGMLADMLRVSGDPHRIIFGLNLPQLKQVAHVFYGDVELASALWREKATRESRLLAPMLVQPEFFTKSDFSDWLADAPVSPEEGDILSHSLLRKLPYATDLVYSLHESTDPMLRYLALRLALNFLAGHELEFKAMAENELVLNNPTTKAVAAQLKDEADFLLKSSDE